MSCIDLDKGLVSEQEVQDRISRFGDYDMSSKEADDFLDHIAECKSCHKDTLLYAEMIKDMKIHITYNKLVAAKKNEEWEKVVALGKEMTFRGYSEEVYPIKDKVREAVKNIKSNPILVTIGGKSISLGVITKKVSETLYSSGKLLIKRGKKLLKEFEIEDAPASEFADSDEHTSLNIYEDAFIRIELSRGGYQDKLTFIPKK
jgi:hypothetical protein